MHSLRLCIFVFLFAAPLSVLAADPQTQIPQNVEEPDAPDDDSEMPPESPESPAAAAPRPEAKPVVPDVKPASVAGESGDASYDEVVLRALNKVTARSQTIEATLGSVVRFGTIEIAAHRCWKAAPDERPENAALLEISEIKQGEAPSLIFSGWMFSSTPGLSALEHPFYDISVVGCAKAEAEKTPEKPAPAPAPKKPKVKSQ